VVQIFKHVYFFLNLQRLRIQYWHSNVVLRSAKVKGNPKLGARSIVSDVYLNGEFECGDNCRLFDCTLIGSIRLGRYSRISGPNTDIVSQINTVSIGSFCSIARNVSIQEFDHNIKSISSSFISTNYFGLCKNSNIVSKGSVQIGNDVWIGTKSIILGGVRLGDGVVVAANSVVTKSFPPYAIVAGTPAKIISYRFEQNIVKRLLDLQWWSFSDSLLHKIGVDLFSEELNETNLARIENLANDSND